MGYTFRLNNYLHCSVWVVNLSDTSDFGWKKLYSMCGVVLDITLHYGLTPEIYYVPVTRVGPPYGNAYGHYKKYKNDYRRVVLVDNDVVNLVNLRFMSEYHGIPPETVMDRRGRGEAFFVMNDEFRKEKAKFRDSGNDKARGKDRFEKKNGKSDKKDWSDNDDSDKNKKGKNKNNGRGK